LPSQVAHVYAYMGDADRAFEWLDRAIEQNEAGLAEQFLNPFYRPIHTDPRWSRFPERVGSSPEKLNAIEFEVTLPGQ
jgi:adenylate cyclase